MPWIFLQHRSQVRCSPSRVLSYLISSVGTVPAELCGGSITSISISLNNQIDCYSDCLSTVSSMSTGTISSCNSASDLGLCSLVGSTNIASLTLYLGWSCDISGFLDSGYCSNWGLWCDNNNEILALELEKSSLTGPSFALTIW